MSATVESASQYRRDYLWNTAASLMSSLSFVIMLTAVTRSAGVAAAGVFSLAIALGQQFQTVGMFEVRTYHVTDVTGKFPFGVYASTRIVTTGLMLVGIVGYGLYKGGESPHAVLTGLLVAALRLFDAAEDVFYSEFQRGNRLDIGGRACFWRILTTTGVFSVMMLATADLLVATAVSFGVSTIVFAFVYLPPARRMFPLSPTWDWRQMGSLLADCLPLFLGAFLATYLTNEARYAIDEYRSVEEQGYFSIIYMPAVAINMLALLVFRPLLTPMARRWAEGDAAGFLRIVRRGLATTGLAFIVVAAVSALAGPQILRLVFGQDVSAYMVELLVLVGAGALNSASVIIYYALTTIRLQRLVCVGYLVAAVDIYVAATLWVPEHGLLGASLAYAQAVLVLVLVFAGMLLHRVGRMRGAGS
ncbi:lipopolysaccharide biosynthesis protein [Actinomyces sp. B33]|uniref:lipopolysaccharide biosynthesis protein n=1 Tax=Actinomyces sp. B33 TaxID=2942131 RepID=UPI0023427698|nr:lipopolysaccharide biosynthesis protein [Actinomyces sp. B33]MDC4232644.1 lipopolysaccharide biosynthesis protein [Actinomyces sp. B33]